MTWTVSELVPAAVKARERSRDRLVGQIEQDGAIRDRCGSRILESALLLRLVDGGGDWPVLQASLVNYLKNAPRNDFLDTRVAQAALGNQGRPEEITAYLAGFQHFTGARKKLMLTTLLSLVGPVPLDPRYDLEQIRYGGYAIWTDVALCAIKILHGHERGPTADPTTDGDRDYLIRQLRSFASGDVWEGNALAHLLALHALRTYQPDCALLRNGIAALARQRNHDGGVPFIAGQEVWVTALAGTALADASCPPPLLERMGDYLAARQLPDGGWGYDDTTTQTDVDDTSRCMEFLCRADPIRYREELDRARAYLTSMAGPDGGFPTYLPGHVSEADLTAGAVIALAPTRQQNPELLDASLDFLIAAQREDGTFENSWTRSESSVIHHVLTAFARTGSPSPALAEGISQAISRAISRLEACQNADGGWGHHPGDPSDAVSTAHAASILTCHGRHRAAEHAIGYLIRRQRPDGGYPTVPDQVGPRPIPYTFPALTDVHVLTAFNDWQRQGRN